MSKRVCTLAFAGVLASASPAVATVHLMLIEQVIGGVNGNTNVQAIQLRTRVLANQCALNPARLWVRDTNGSNPVLLLDFSTECVPLAQCLTPCVASSRILIASSNFTNFTEPDLSPDFTLTNLIPPSYIAGGSLTFESNTGTIFWRLSWGTYSGPTNGSITNDPDGDFGTPVPGPLPSTGLEALLFMGAATGVSSTNAADYGLTGGPAVFTSFDGSTGTITKPPPGCPWDCEDVPNGFVDIGDLFKLFGHWGLAGPCDFDGGGGGITDLFDMFGNWGICP